MAFRDAQIKMLEDRIRELEIVLAYEARVVEAQASLHSDSKYIGKNSKAILREQVEKMREVAAGGGAVVDKREYRSLIHYRHNHGESAWGCDACIKEGLR